MKDTSFVKLILALWLSAVLIVVVLPTLTVGIVDWVRPITVSALYAALCGFVLIARMRLADYHIDSLSLIAFLLFATVLRFDNVSFNWPDYVSKAIVWILAAILIIAIISGHVPFALPTKKQTAYLVIGILAGLLLALFGAYVIVHKPGFQAEPVDAAPYTSMNYVARALEFYGSYGGVPEEFIFRGLFWGYLMKKSYGEERASLVQGLGFWLSHFDRMFVSPVGFWVVIPICTIVFSLLTYRSRSLIASIAAHTIFDALQGVLAVIMMART